MCWSQHVLPLRPNIFSIRTDLSLRDMQGFLGKRTETGYALPLLLVDSRRMDFYNGFKQKPNEHGSMPLSYNSDLSNQASRTNPGWASSVFTSLDQETLKRLSLVPRISQWPTSLPWIFLGSGGVLFPDNEYTHAIFVEWLHTRKCVWFATDHSDQRDDSFDFCC